MQSADEHLLLSFAHHLGLWDLTRLKMTCSRFNKLLTHWRRFSIREDCAFMFSWYRAIDAWAVVKGDNQWFPLFMEFKYPTSRGWWSESWRMFFVGLAKKIIKYAHATQVENIAYLIERGLDIEKESLLSIAVGRGNKEMIAYFLSLGVNVNTADGKLITPLHVAFYCYQIEIAQLLIERRASTVAEDKHGRSPLDVARLVQQHPQLPGIMQLLAQWHIHTQINSSTTAEP